MMSRRHSHQTPRAIPLLRAAALLAAWLGFVWPAAEAAQAADRRQPNIVILLADDLGYADVGFQGCRDIPTPHIDSLARGGVRCTNGYVSCPYCSPTRAGLMTGRYQQRFGHEFNPGANQRPNVEIGLPVDQTTIADRLKGAGYATGLVGKWHLGGLPKFHPQRRGFDEFFGFTGGAHDYFDLPGDPILRGTQAVDEHAYLTDALGREAVAFIDRHQQRPFFLYLAFNAVHTPMQADDARLAKFSTIADEARRTYAAMLSAMDDSIGRVLEKLRACGLEEDTLLVLFSDNGGPTMPGTTINASRNTPLRGSKRTTLEGGIRVPFVVQWKRRLPQDTVYPHPVIQLDILPTALAAAGVELPAAANLDGVNLLPHLRGEKQAKPHVALYWRLGTQRAVRHGDWKLVQYDSAADGGPAAVPTPLKLYNLADDVGETHDRAHEQPEKFGQLARLWEQWDAQLAEPLWGPEKKLVPRAKP